jgi:hypothetical protein
MIYLATPYSDPEPKMREMRYRCACLLAARLTFDGHVVFSPIVHGHAMERVSGLELSRGEWMRIDSEFLRRSDLLLVAKMPGWDASLGVRQEIGMARAFEIPVEYWEVP